MFFRGQLVGKYKILRPIGSGGFGTVYLAEDTWIDKRVALKVPHKQSLDFGELLREPRLLASLNHPNIVTILTAERQENVFFIVMEFVPGETLEAIIARDGALDVARAVDYTCQICNAVDHAHRHGVLHRDLRPSNVLVAENGMLKVADFGTSRFLEIAAHGTTVIGSPPYMAPEQFQGKAVFASDIYSLGVTIYQMLTGVLPYDTPSPADLNRLLSGELLREPRLLASLNHPNIVTILTAEKQESVFFIVMESVPGETLETIIAREGPLDVARALDYTCQISNAVDHAHKQGVIHRDLRPSNVLVAEIGRAHV